MILCVKSHWVRFIKYGCRKRIKFTDAFRKSDQWRGIYLPVEGRDKGLKRGFVWQKEGRGCKKTSEENPRSLRSISYIYAVNGESLLSNAGLRGGFGRNLRGNLGAGLLSRAFRTLFRSGAGVLCIRAFRRILCFFLGG